MMRIVAHHRAADVGDLAVVLDRRVEHLLHPVHVRREAGDVDALPAVVEDAPARMTGPCSIGPSMKRTFS